jgi:hypothetical protein
MGSGPEDRKQGATLPAWLDGRLPAVHPGGRASRASAPAALPAQAGSKPAFSPAFLAAFRARRHGVPPSRRA